MRPADDHPPTCRRLTVQEAASRLGVTVDAVRGRLKRGTLSSDRDEDGTVYVLLDHADQPDDQPSASHRPADDQLRLVEVLQEQITYHLQQLEEAHRANAEHRRLLAAALERIPELEAPQEVASEATESRVATSEGADRGEGHGPQKPSQRRSWWRESFGA
jgi:hypothetical protein